MKWTNTELADVWHDKEEEQRYLLMLEIKQDWKNTTQSLEKFYFNKSFRDYKYYIGHVIHDGNRSLGMLEYVIQEYEKENRFPKDLNGWHSCQGVLEYIRQGEVLLQLFSIA